MFVSLKSTIEKFLGKFIELPVLPKKIVKIGLIFSLLIFAAGTIVVLGNRYFFSYEPYYDYIGTQLVKTSFTVLAEFVVGAIAMDFVFGRSK